MKPAISAHKRDMILKWHENGYSTAETANLLNLPEQVVKDVIKQATQPTQPTPPADAQDIPLF
ncbi:hypothetical protein CQR46_0942 [Bifidobacterium pseudolongum subsp. globosum]|uniref:Uncharacterized protein n=1 Tax=Bifidobacterium pseudolongum subsp. globosum TaxID=1690 RepID=A0A2N3QHL8_9BIFI|nr:hypothetical protein [Bifidobacterium pseudolongum]PKU90746.1 hypothetical protein CQR46_0942 [Bifidobacterium pseudolongum subsp. globosum]